MHFLQKSLMLIGRYDKEFNDRLQRTFKNYAVRIIVLFAAAAGVALISEFLSGTFVLFYIYLGMLFTADLCGIYYVRNTRD